MVDTLGNVGYSESKFSFLNGKAFEFGKGWITGSGFLPDSEGSDSSDLYYGFIEYSNGMSILGFSVDKTVFALGDPRVNHGAGWIKGPGEIEADLNSASRVIYYRAEEFGQIGWQFVYSVDSPPIGSAYVEISSGWITGLEEFEVDYSDDAQTVYSGYVEFDGPVGSLFVYGLSGSSFDGIPTQEGEGWVTALDDWVSN